MSAGFNLVAWGGADATLTSAAIASIEADVLSVSRFDDGVFRTFDLRVPAVIRDDFTLSIGDGIWVQTSSAVVWEQAGAAPIPQESFTTSGLIVVAVPESNTLFATVSDNGTLYTATGSRNADGSIRQLETVTVEHESAQVILEHDDLGRVTRAEGTARADGSFVAVSLSYGLDVVEIALFDSASAGEPSAEFTVDLADFPATSVPAFARRSPGAEPQLRVAADGSTALQVRAEVRNTSGVIVPGMQVRASLWLPPGLFTSLPFATLLDDQIGASDPSQPGGAIARLDYLLTPTADGGFTGALPLTAAVNDPEIVEQNCLDARATLDNVATGLSTLSFVAGLVTFGQSSVAKEVAEHVMWNVLSVVGAGVGGWGIAFPPQDSDKFCRHISGLASDELQRPYWLSTEIVSSARGAAWPGGPRTPDVGRTSPIQFITGEQIQAAVLIGQDLTLATTITVVDEFVSVAISDHNDGPIEVGKRAFFTVAIAGGTPPYRLFVNGPGAAPAETDAFAPGLTEVTVTLPNTNATRVEVTVRDAEGFTISASITVAATFGGPDFVTLSGPEEPVMAGEAVIFAAVTTGGAPGPISWDLPAGAEVLSEETRADDGSASITFQLTLTESTQVCVSASDTDGGRAGPTCLTVDILLVTNITASGSVSASTSFGNDSDFFPSRAVDNSTSTSWFSSGPGSGGTTVFTWSASTDFHITSVEFIGNGSHSVGAFRSGFGFTTVQVLLLDASNNVVATRTGSGFGDTFGFDHVARSVQLVFSGHEDPSCGGFSELDIFGYEGG